MSSSSSFNILFVRGHKVGCCGRFPSPPPPPPLSFHLCGTGSGKAELRAGWLPAASGGGPEGREPMAGRSTEPSRTAGKRPAPTAPHQVVPNPIIHATTLTHTQTVLPSAQLLPSSAQSSSDQHTNCTAPGNG